MLSIQQCVEAGKKAARMPNMKLPARWNVYGKSGETITFRVMHRESGEVQIIAEQEPLYSDLLGTIQKPYELHIGNFTGIISTNGYQDKNSTAVYDIQGRKVDKNQMKKGVYVVVEDNHSQAKKVVK